MIWYKQICLIFCYLQFMPNFSQTQEDLPCETPDGEYGSCILVKKCTSVLDLILTRGNDKEVRTFLRASACGYKNNNPLVCCPQVKTRQVDVNNLPTPNPSISKTKLPLSPNCGYSNVTNPRVVGGVPAQLGEFPWMVNLGYKNSKNPNQPRWLCGGTLITNRHVLTAAHCVFDQKDLYLVRVGDLDLFSDDDGANPVDIPISKVKLHESYNRVNPLYDIAIITLTQTINDIKEVRPICLPVEEPLRSNKFLNTGAIVAGWGRLNYTGPTSSNLQLARIPVVPNDKCQQNYGRAYPIIDSVLCAGVLAGGVDSCKGDSGGPLMLRKPEPEHNILRVYQIGIVSYGIRCAEPGYPGVYTRITAYIDWIQNSLD